MSRPSTPQISPLDANTRNPLQPGPNSWAQSAEKAGKMKIEKSGPPTNRDKYENKPMPPLPRTPEQGKSPTAPSQPNYIQPATPLIYSHQTPSKNRAVTDPIASKTVFGANKVSIGELRRKFSGTKPGSNLSSIEETANARSRTPKLKVIELPTVPSVVNDSDKNQHTHPPSSAPPSTQTPDPFRSSGTQERQHQSSSAPTRRCLRENSVPDPSLVRSSPIPSYMTPEAVGQEVGSPDGIIVGDGKLNPTRNGTYGTTGEVEFVEGKAAHRVASFAAIIENASSPHESESKNHFHSADTASSASMLSGQNITHLLQPNLYSPSEYGGVWENDPHVGHTLPPFSPMHLRRPFEPELQHKNSSLGSRGTIPFTVNQDQYGQPSRLSAYPPSIMSTNSWAPQVQEPFPPPNSATVPPLFSDTHNPVPPPPHTYPDYQASVRQVSPDLARLELTLHHHLDSCFGSLSRLVTDKHDHTVDHLLRRLESHERKVEKSHKSLKGDIKDIRQDMESLREDVQNIQKSIDWLKESAEGTDVKTNTIDSKVDKIQSSSDSFHHTLADLNLSVHAVGAKCDRIAEHTRQSASTESKQQHNGQSPSRSQSTNASPALQSQRHQHQSGASQTSGSGWQSDSNSRSRRSNTASGGVGARSSDGRSSRRQHFAEMGVAMGEAPDLRQHPAYISQQQNYGYDSNGAAMAMDSGGTIYHIPSFTGHGPNGWYQQAYGQS